MAKINLLPWRERLREKQKKEFMEIAGLCAVVGVFIVFIWGTLIGLEIDNQVSRNERIKAEIKTLDKEIEEVQSLEKKRDVLVSRMKIVSDLQANRPYIVHIFDELVKSLPEGVYYSSINRAPGSVRLNGIADSNESVSALMRKLEASNWFKDPILTGVVNRKTTILDSKSKTKSAKTQDESTFNLVVLEEGSPSAATPTPAPKKPAAKGATK